MSEIDLRKTWDVILFVILDQAYEAIEIYEAHRKTVIALIDPISNDPDSNKAKLPVRKFIRAAKRIWCRNMSA